MEFWTKLILIEKKNAIDQYMNFNHMEKKKKNEN